jgi:predicted transposase YdaD
MSAVEQQHNVGVSEMTEEERWVLCEMIRDGVEKVDQLEADARELEAQLEETRSKQEQVKLGTLEALSQVAGGRKAERIAA